MAVLWQSAPLANVAGPLPSSLDKGGTHAMRKTIANRVYHQLNHDLVKTQRAMGHKNINSTVAYLSFVEDEIDQAILAS